MTTEAPIIIENGVFRCPTCLTKNDIAVYPSTIRYEYTFNSPTLLIGIVLLYTVNLILKSEKRKHK